MTDLGGTPRRRAERLLYLYPSRWRTRYGEEFVELLAADIEERPRSCRRLADLMASGALARFRMAGLAGGVLDPPTQIQSSLAAVGCAVAASWTLGVAMFSQVIVGWRWAPPTTPSVAVSMVTMLVAAVLMVLLALAAAGPWLWVLLRAISHHQGRALLRPCLLMIAALAGLILGSRHFEDHWPGSGGHPWAYHGLVPSGAAAFAWAATRGLTSYWMHPGALAKFDAADIMWMAVSPLAIVAIIVGLTKTVRRLELTPRIQRYEVNLARGAVAVMVLFTGGASCWVVADGTPGPTGIYRVGTIDILALAAMAAALIGAYHAASRATAARAALSPTPSAPAFPTRP